MEDNSPSTLFLACSLSAVEKKTRRFALPFFSLSDIVTDKNTYTYTALKQGNVMTREAIFLQGLLKFAYISKHNCRLLCSWST